MLASPGDAGLVYLQVEAANRAARALYEQAGLSTVYRYSHRREAN